MPPFVQQVLSALPKLTLLSVADIFVVAFLIYQFLMVIRGRRAAHILTGVGVLAVAYLISVLLGLELLSVILSNIAPYAPFAIIVIFQSEIRRMLARIGRMRWANIGGRIQRREITEELALALTQLSATKTGALIVIERDIGLRTFVESGLRLEAALSRDLLLTIFHTGSVLHDGAVIIQGDRVAAAACFLPLSVNPLIARKLGTRHRAAIGITEETDCLALVASEETGRMSVVAFGEIEFDVTEERLVQRINEHLFQKRSRDARLVDALEETQLERQTAHDAHTD